MYPILLDWNGLFIPAWHFFYMLAAIAALFFLFHINIKWQIDLSPKYLSGLYTVAYIGGYFGARSLSIFVDESNKVLQVSDFFWLLFSFGPMTFYGGMIGASLFACLFAYFYKIPLSKVLDLGIPPGMLGLSIGRIGCFLNGDDYGIPIPGSMIAEPPWWAVTFPNHYELIPRVPVQLIESFLVLVLIMCVYFLRSKSISKLSFGFTGLSMIICYAIIRFPVEYLRGDPRGWVIQDHLSTSQLISLVILTILSPIAYLINKKET